MICHFCKKEIEEIEMGLYKNAMGEIVCDDRPVRGKKLPVHIDAARMIGNIIIHNPRQCGGEYCTFHNPSEHHMKDWPINIRMDREGCLTERICPHGVGHPDPDSVAYLKPIYGESVEIHGCDGCCNG